MLDSILSAILEILVEGTGRAVLTAFGIKGSREFTATFVGMAVWVVVGLMIFVLVLVLRKGS